MNGFFERVSQVEGEQDAAAAAACGRVKRLDTSMGGYGIYAALDAETGRKLAEAGYVLAKWRTRDGGQVEGWH